MFKRFLGFLTAAALLVGLGYLFWLNPSSAELRLSSTRSYTLPVPLLLLLSFLLGATLVFLLALLRETQWTLAAWRNRRRQDRADRRRTALATGRLLSWEGRPERARSVLRRVATAPDDLEASLLLAETALDSDRPEEALGILEEAAGRHREHPQLLATLSETYRRLGRRGEATVALEKAAAHEARSPRLLAALRDSYVEEGRWADALRAEEMLLAALQHPEQILLEQPRVVGLRFEAAIALDGDAGAIESLRAVVAQSPTFLPAVVALGDRLRDEGKGREAARIWMRAASLRPSPILLLRLDALMVDLGRTKAMSSFYRRLRRASDSPAVALQQARFLIAQGVLDEATSALESARAIADHLPEYHATWAQLHRLQGRPTEAFDALRVADASRLPVYLCRDCGRLETEWRPRCAGCGLWDALESSAERPP